MADSAENPIQLDEENERRTLLLQQHQSLRDQHHPAWDALLRIRLFGLRKKMFLIMFLEIFSISITVYFF